MSISEASQIPVGQKSSGYIRFVLFLLFVSFINASPFSPFRIVDLLAMLFFVFYLTKPASLKIVCAFFAILSLLFASMLCGVVLIGMQNPENFFFLYKYVAIFLAVSICRYVFYLGSKELNILIIRVKFLLLMLVLLLLSIYAVSLFFGEIRGYTTRMSFSYLPFHAGFRGDSHLFAGVCTVFFLFCALFCKNKIDFIILLLIFLCGILSGSRNFMVALLIGGVPYLGKIKFRVLLFFWGGISVLFFFSWPFLEPLLIRTLRIDLSAASEMARIQNFFAALRELEPTRGILGIGMQSSSFVWFDGGIPAVLTSLGALGLLGISFFVMLTVLKILNVHSKDKWKVLFFLFAIIATNIITEFFLVSRYLFPVMLLFFIALASLRFSSTSSLSERSLKTRRKNRMVF